MNTSCSAYWTASRHGGRRRADRRNASRVVRKPALKALRVATRNARDRRQRPLSLVAHSGSQLQRRGRQVGSLALIEETYGLRFDFSREEELSLPAASTPELRAAQPVPDEPDVPPSDPATGD